MRNRLTTAILLLSAAPAPAHRLDEYLQAALLSIAKDRIQAEITLTPGVAVFPIVIAGIDTDGDGVVSQAEQRAYAARVLRELSLTLDGRPLTPRLLSLRFPSPEEMKQGQAGIRIGFQADLPRGGPGRRLVFENRHQGSIGAYLVNCLVPVDPAVRIVAQDRNYTQSHYQVDYVVTGARTAILPWEWSDGRVCLGILAAFLCARFALLWRGRTGLRTSSPPAP